MRLSRERPQPNSPRKGLTLRSMKLCRAESRIGEISSGAARAVTGTQPHCRSWRRGEAKSSKKASKINGASRRRSRGSPGRGSRPQAGVACTATVMTARRRTPRGCRYHITFKRRTGLWGVPACFRLRHPDSLMTHHDDLLFLDDAKPSQSWQTQNSPWSQMSSTAARGPAQYNPLKKCAAGRTLGARGSAASLCRLTHSCEATSAPKRAPRCCSVTSPPVASAISARLSTCGWGQRDAGAAAGVRGWGTRLHPRPARTCTLAFTHAHPPTGTNKHRPLLQGAPA